MMTSVKLLLVICASAALLVQGAERCSGATGSCPQVGQQDDVDTQGLLQGALRRHSDEEEDGVQSKTEGWQEETKEQVSKADVKSDLESVVKAMSAMQEKVAKQEKAMAEQQKEMAEQQKEMSEQLEHEKDKAEQQKAMAEQLEHEKDKVAELEKEMAAAHASDNALSCSRVTMHYSATAATLRSLCARAYSEGLSPKCCASKSCCKDVMSCTLEEAFRSLDMQCRDKDNDEPRVSAVPESVLLAQSYLGRSMSNVKNLWKAAPNQREILLEYEADPSNALGALGAPNKPLDTKRDPKLDARLLLGPIITQAKKDDRKNKQPIAMLRARLDSDSARGAKGTSAWGKMMDLQASMAGKIQAMEDKATSAKEKAYWAAYKQTGVKRLHNAAQRFGKRKGYYHSSFQSNTEDNKGNVKEYWQKAGGSVAGRAKGVNGFSKAGRGGNWMSKDVFEQRVLQAQKGSKFRKHERWESKKLRAQGAVFEAGTQVITALVQGKTMDWKLMADIGLNVLSCFAPFTGFAASILMSFLMPGEESEMEKMMTEMDKKIRQAKIDDLDDTLKDTTEELDWVEPMLMEDGSNPTQDHQTRLSYFLMLQHSLAQMRTQMFHRACVAMQPWVALVQGLGCDHNGECADTRVFEAGLTVRFRGKLLQTEAKLEEKMPDMSLIEEVGAAEKEGEMDTVLAGKKKKKSEPDECKLAMENAKRIKVITGYAELQMSALTTILLLNDDFAAGVGQRVEKLGLEYAGLIHQAYTKFWIKKRKSDVKQAEETGSTSITDTTPRRRYTHRRRRTTSFSYKRFGYKDDFIGFQCWDSPRYYADGPPGTFLQQSEVVEASSSTGYCMVRLIGVPTSGQWQCDSFTLNSWFYDKTQSTNNGQETVEKCAEKGNWHNFCGTLAEYKIEGNDRILRKDGTPVIVTIGPSPKTDPKPWRKCVDNADPVECDADAGNANKRVNKHTGGETYKITVAGTQVCAWRTDQEKEWAHNLRIKCRKASSDTSEPQIIQIKLDMEANRCLDVVNQGSLANGAVPNVHIADCDPENPNQQWIMSGGKIKNAHNPNSCMSAQRRRSEGIIMEKCNTGSDYDKIWTYYSGTYSGRLKNKVGRCLDSRENVHATTCSTVNDQRWRISSQEQGWCKIRLLTEPTTPGCQHLPVMQWLLAYEHGAGGKENVTLNHCKGYRWESVCGADVEYRVRTQAAYGQCWFQLQAGDCKADGRLQKGVWYEDSKFGGSSNAMSLDACYRRNWGNFCQLGGNDNTKVEYDIRDDTLPDAGCDYSAYKRKVGANEAAERDVNVEAMLCYWKQARVSLGKTVPNQDVLDCGEPAKGFATCTAGDNIVAKWAKDNKWYSGYILDVVTATTANILVGDYPPQDAWESRPLSTVYKTNKQVTDRKWCWGKNSPTACNNGDVVVIPCASFDQEYCPIGFIRLVSGDCIQKDPIPVACNINHRNYKKQATAYCEERGLKLCGVDQYKEAFADQPVFGVVPTGQSISSDTCGTIGEHKQLKAGNPILEQCKSDHACSTNDNFRCCVQAPKCPTGYTETEKNLDGAGKFEHENTDATADFCAAVCQTRFGCTSFEFDKDGTSNPPNMCITYTGGQDNIQTSSQASGWLSCTRDYTAPRSLMEEASEVQQTENETKADLIEEASEVQQTENETKAEPQHESTLLEEAQEEAQQHESTLLEEAQEEVQDELQYFKSNGNNDRLIRRRRTRRRRSRRRRARRRSSVYGGGCPKGYYEIWYNLDGTGKQYKKISGGLMDKAGACAKHCNHRHGCTSFEYAVTSHMSSTCYTYTGGSANVQTGGQGSTWQSCFKAKSYNGYGCEAKKTYTHMNSWYPNRDAGEGDCSWSCFHGALKLWCTHYTFNVGNGGTCKLYDCFPKGFSTASFGHKGDNYCPPGSVGLSEGKCGSKPVKRALYVKEYKGKASQTDKPPGCYAYGDMSTGVSTMFNSQTKGKNSGDQWPVCKKEFAYANGGAMGCPKGWLPIRSKWDCEEAVHTRGLRDYVGKEGAYGDAPWGCYGLKVGKSDNFGNRGYFNTKSPSFFTASAHKDMQLLCKADCSQMPPGPNAPKVPNLGCSGAKWSGGGFAHAYCTNSEDKELPILRWYKACCHWDKDKCVKKEDNSLDGVLQKKAAAKAAEDKEYFYGTDLEAACKTTGEWYVKDDGKFSLGTKVASGTLVPSDCQAACQLEAMFYFNRFPSGDCYCGDLDAVAQEASANPTAQSGSIYCMP